MEGHVGLKAINAAAAGSVSPTQIPKATVVSAGPSDRLCENLQRRQIPGLNALRGGAALAVVASHRLMGLAQVGSLAVQMFFLLSGLLITWTMLTERERTGHLNLRRFYIRRALRQLPGLSVLLLMEILVDQPYASGKAIASSFVYVSNYYVAICGNGVLGGLGHTWSLAVEEHFYFLWPMVFCFCYSRRLVVWVGAAAALSAGIRYGVDSFVSSNYAYYSAESNAFAILAGCALALWLWGRRIIPRFLLWRPLLLVSLVILVLGAKWIPSAIVTRFAALWTLPLAVILLQSIAYEWRVLENPCMSLLGRISYSIYLWHLVASQLVLGHGLTGLARAGTLFGSAIAFGAVSYFLVERPVQEWGRRRFLAQSPNRRGASGPPGALAQQTGPR